MLDLTFGAIDVSARRGTVTLQLGFSKSGKRKGESESLVIEDRPFAILVQAYVHNRMGGDRLWSKKGSEFRSCFSRLIDLCGLDSHRYKPYSIRRGGATHHYRVCGSLDKVVTMGRWNALSTARIYIQEAQSEASAVNMGSEQLKCIKRGRGHWVEFLKK